MMTKGKFFTVAAAMTLMSIPQGAALAASSSDFKKADADRSGTLSESEYRDLNISGSSFTTLDANGDNVLTLSEMQASNSAGTNTSIDTPAGRASISGDVSTDTSGSMGSAGGAASGSTSMDR